MLAGALALLVAGSAQAAPHPGASGRFHRSICAAAAGRMHCLALQVTNASGQPLATASTPQGYGPSSLRSAYSLGTTAGAGETVAIVDAYNEPHLASDLGVYRSQYGLPPADGKAGDPTLTIVNQTAGTSLPQTDSGWGDEEALDVDMVSAACPHCNILMVEAKSPSDANLLAAEQTAQKHAGVVAVSNSWDGSEFSGETADDKDFGQHPTTVATGDSGTGAAWPATSPNVTAVGGTTLTFTNGVSSETAWADGGSGCSAFEPTPSFQLSFPGFPAGCAHRAEADVAAVGDPNTGVAVYDSCGDRLSAVTMPARCSGASGWEVFGGTSVATPLIASVYALANNNGSAATVYQNYTATHGANFHDVTSGSNGTCSPAWVCHAGPGYDGPTGLGTPKGTGAF
jgi:subtilase family serine protease